MLKCLLKKRDSEKYRRCVQNVAITSSVMSISVMSISVMWSFLYSINFYPNMALSYFFVNDVVQISLLMKSHPVIQLIISNYNLSS